MLGAGTVINPIIKIVTTVVILGAVYLFIVKPTLDTTNDVVNQSLGAFNGAFDVLAITASPRPRLTRGEGRLAPGTRSPRAPRGTPGNPAPGSPTEAAVPRPRPTS